jgi:hypothetical protein
MNTLNRFFYRIDGQGYPIPGTLQRWREKPKHGHWKELDYSNVCCIEPGVGCQDVADRTILSNVFSTTGNDSYEIEFINDGSGIFSYSNASLTNVVDEFNLVYYGFAEFTIIDLGGDTAQVQMIANASCTALFEIAVIPEPTP